jgi:hypothetical protein
VKWIWNEMKGEKVLQWSNLHFAKAFDDQECKTNPWFQMAFLTSLKSSETWIY